MNKRVFILILVGIGLIPVLAIAFVLAQYVAYSVADVLEMPSHPPTEAELVGYYKISEEDRTSLEGERIFMSRESGFKLGPDHKLEAIDLLALDFGGNPRACNYNGTGEWNLSGDELEMIIDVVSPPGKGNTRSCDPERFGRFEIRGRVAPYRFRRILGDPDEGRYLTYKRH